MVTVQNQRQGSRHTSGDEKEVTVKKIIGGIGEIVIYMLIFGIVIALLNLHYIYLTSF
jgi:hypothetical protein